MTGYLVIGRAGHDDIPLQLCKTLAKAKAYAKSVPEEIDLAAANMMAADPTTYICVGIVEFIDGKPKQFKKVKTFW